MTYTHNFNLKEIKGVDELKEACETTEFRNMETHHMEVFYDTESKEIISVLNALNWHTDFRDDQIVKIGELRHRNVTDKDILDMLMGMLVRDTADKTGWYGSDIEAIYNCRIFQKADGSINLSNDLLNPPQEAEEIGFVSEGKVFFY